MLAARLGVDAIGLVFYPPSSRYLSVSQAVAILQVVPPFVTTVGLFLDADEKAIRQVLDSVELDCLQFHGNETDAFCRSFGRRYIKSVPMVDTDDIHAYTTRYPGAAGFLLDAVSNGEAGGKGETFDWGRIPQDLAKPLILAGGLRPDNVAEAIRSTRCYAVDVSSGVEVEKGVKSPEKIRKFVEQVKSIQ